MRKGKFKKIEKGCYEYRGIIIRRNPEIPATYNGAWETGSQKGGILGESREDIAEEIDRKLAEKYGE